MKYPQWISGQLRAILNDNWSERFLSLRLRAYVFDRRAILGLA